MKGTKRILSGLLALCMVMSMLPVQTFAEEEILEETAAAAEAATEGAEETVAETEAATESAEETTIPVETEAEPTETEPEPTQGTEAATEPTEEVQPVQVESVTIIQEDGLTELAVGETMQLTAVILPEEAAGAKVIWSSSEDTVATVDEDGVVTALSPGNVVIAAEVGDITGEYALSVAEEIAFIEETIAATSALSGTTLKAQGASFVTRSDGIWLYPLPKENYAVTDWAGCPGQENPSQYPNGNKYACSFPGCNCTPGCGAHYGYPSGHNGIDLYAKTGTNVYASADGKLYCIDKDWDSRGKTAVVEHPIDGTKWSYYTVYQHLSWVNTAKNGSNVVAGEVIAKSGATNGTLSGGAAHLHFEILLWHSGNGELFAGCSGSMGTLDWFECTFGWKLDEGFPEGNNGNDGCRILNNPALNSPAGDPSYYDGCEDTTRRHAGSVMYTFDTTQVSIGESNANNYINQCIQVPSYGTIKITKADANIMDRPCSVKTDPEAKTIESGALDAEYIVTALYENTEGNYWYRIKTKSGGTGYIYSGNCNFTSGLFGDVELTGPNIPTELPHGEPKNIAGTISSPYSKLHVVSFWVYDAAGKKWTGNTVPVSGTSYKLSDPAIDYNVVFNELPVGSYECVVTAKVEAYFVNANGRVGSLYDYELYRGALTIKDPAQIYHTLTFNGNGGTVPQASMSVLHGTTPEYLPMPNFGKEHFAGWYTAAEGGTQVTTSTVITESQTLYAHWGCIHNYSKAEHAPGCVTEGATVYTCFYCGDSYSEPIAALGHDYKGVVTEPTCSSVGYTTYTCSRCSDSYIEENDGNWTEWSEEYPNGVSENLIETQVQYRFRDQETTVHDSDSLEGWTLIGPVSSWSDYGPWSEWSDTAVSESETTKVETRTVWGYYYYLCPNCGKHLYGYGSCFTWANGCGAPTYYHNFCGFWKPVSWDAAGFRDWYGTSQYANLDGEVVFKWTDGGTKTQYRSCTRERIEGYQFCRWGEWSDWEDSVQTESDTRQVETRTVYRYAQNSAGHSFGEWKVAFEPTCTEAGEERQTCDACGAYESREIAALGHSFGEWWTAVAPTFSEKGEEWRVCTVCSEFETREVDAKTVVAMIGGVPYGSVGEALLAAQKGQTVTLAADAEESYLMVASGIKLELGTYNLTADYIVAFEGAAISATPNAGRLIVPKGNLILSEAGTNEKGQSILPVWDPANENYVFSLFVANTGNADRGLFISDDESTLYFQWKHQATGAINKSLMADNGSTDNDVSMLVRLQWGDKDGIAYQNYVFKDSFVQKAAGSFDYTVTLKGIDTLGIDLSTLVVTAMITTESGAEAAGQIWTIENAK